MGKSQPRVVVSVHLVLVLVLVLEAVPVAAQWLRPYHVSHVVVANSGHLAPSPS